MLGHPERAGPGLESSAAGQGAGAVRPSVPPVLPCRGPAFRTRSASERGREAAGEGRREGAFARGWRALLPPPSPHYAVLEGWRRGRAGG